MPERGGAAKACTIMVVSALSLPASASLCSSVGAKAHHRLHHTWTVPRLRCLWRMPWP